MESERESSLANKMKDPSLTYAFSDLMDSFLRLVWEMERMDELAERAKHAMEYGM